jgi:hypothetical protein
MARKRGAEDRITKRCFSERYLALRLREKIEVRRRLEQETIKLRNDCEKLWETLQSFLGELYTFETEKVDLFEAEEKIKNFRQASEELSKRLVALARYAQPFFEHFEPLMPEQSLEINNPLEMRMHKILRSIQGMPQFLQQAEIQFLILKRNRKRK